MERKCCMCQFEKNLDEFPRDKQSNLGYSYRCKECNRLRGKEYSKNMPDDVKERKRQKRREYGKANREKINQRLRLKHAENSDKIKEKARKYRESHKKEMREYSDKWRKENWEKVLAQSIVQDHVTRGNIEKPKICPICKSGDYRIEAHHFDYEKPLDINWFCQKCHMALHQRINEEKKLSEHRERLNETASDKEDVIVRSEEETFRDMQK